MSDLFGGADDGGADWSEAFGVGASRPEDADGVDVGGADAGAVSGAFDFEPDGVSSDDDYDFTGDGVVDHHDVHEALSGFHDFHVEEPEPSHHEPVDHHVDDHASHGLHHDAHDVHDAHDGGELFGF
jgi:hypothetical protein